MTSSRPPGSTPANPHQSLSKPDQAGQPASHLEDDADRLKFWVRQMNSAKLMALWRWIMLEFMQRCREEQAHDTSGSKSASDRRGLLMNVIKDGETFLVTQILRKKGEDMNEFLVIKDGETFLVAKKNDGARWKHLFWSECSYWTECVSRARFFDSEEKAIAQMKLLVVKQL